LAVNEERYNDINAYVSFWNINNLEKPFCIKTVPISEIVLGTGKSKVKD
jgi:hypothetical protein